MGKISILAGHVANLIAAGEVVDRPASVIKELVENSIDAGAGTVTIEVKGNGVSFIRITDNGAGMSCEDMKNSFKRHATSKIHDEIDLESIETLGFRGEALAAVSAVSKVEMFSCERGFDIGNSLVIEGGNLVSCEEVGCPAGTTVIVRDIFYNTPARAKFLKKDATELAHIMNAIEWLALSSPDVAISFIRDGQKILSTPGGGDLRGTVYSVLGKDAFSGLTEVNYELDGISVKGYASKPLNVRANRNLQYFFLNGRYVRSKVFTYALEDSYRNKMMVGRYPYCVLYITMNPKNSDINVHPAKLEVKLQNERLVHDAIYFGVKSAIEDGDSIYPLKLHQMQKEKNLEPKLNTSGNSYKNSEDKKDNKEQIMLSQQLMDDFIVNVPKEIFNAAGNENNTLQKPKIDVEKPETKVRPTISDREIIEEINKEPKDEKPILSETFLPKAEDIRLIGELFSTYIVAQQGDDAFLIDKHAAHERLIYERLMSGYYANYKQILLSPIVVNLSPIDAAELLKNTELLSDAGFDISEFGSSSIIVREVPCDLEQGDVTSLLEELSRQLQEGRSKIISAQKDRMFKTIACRAAVKANQKNSITELDSLIKELFMRTDIRYCPHGRPISVVLTKSELERQFGRLGSPNVSGGRKS